MFRKWLASLGLLPSLLALWIWWGHSTYQIQCLYYQSAAVYPVGVQALFCSYWYLLKKNILPDEELAQRLFSQPRSPCACMSPAQWWAGVGHRVLLSGICTYKPGLAHLLLLLKAGRVAPLVLCLWSGGTLSCWYAQDFSLLSEMVVLFSFSLWCLEAE